MKTLGMMDGYCFELSGESQNWRASSESLWDIDIYTPDGTERYAGSRFIDGCRCRVYWCHDGTYRAQTWSSLASVK